MSVAAVSLNWIALIDGWMSRESHRPLEKFTVFCSDPTRGIVLGLGEHWSIIETSRCDQQPTTTALLEH